MHKFLQIGKIAGAHGIKGELKVIPLTDDPKRYKKLKNVYINENDRMVEYRVENVRITNNTVLVKLSGIDDRDRALDYKNLFILIDRKDAVTLPEDTYFICDIIGCSVYDDGRFLGEVTEVLETGSNDVYVVRGENNQEILIPALKSVIVDVDIENKKIAAKLPEGLIDDEI